VIYFPARNDLPPLRFNYPIYHLIISLAGFPAFCQFGLLSPWLPESFPVSLKTVHGLRFTIYSRLIPNQLGSERRYTMKAGIFFTGTGPILILTSYQSLGDPKLAEKLKQKGIKKYIAYEVPEDHVKQRYGQHYNVILGDLKQTDDLRVLDYDGHHVFYNFTLNEMGEPVYHDAGA